MDSNNIDIEIRNKDIWRLDAACKPIKPGDLMLPKNLYSKLCLSNYSIDILNNIILYKAENEKKEVVCNISPFRKTDTGFRVSAGLAPLVNSALSKLFIVAEYFKVKDAPTPALFKHFPNTIYFGSEGASYGKLSSMVANEDNFEGNEVRKETSFFLSCRELKDKKLNEIILYIEDKKLKLLHEWLCENVKEAATSFEEFEKKFIDWTASILGVKSSDFQKDEEKMFILYNKTKLWKQTLKILRGVKQRSSILSKSVEFYSFHIQRNEEEIDECLNFSGNYHLGGTENMNVHIDPNLQTASTVNGRLLGFKVWAEHPKKKGHKEYFFKQ